MNNDLVYLHRRAGEERRAALKCKSKKIRGIHLEFAHEYESRVLLLEQLAASNTRQALVCYADQQAERGTAENPKHTEQRH